jgi:MoaA/NifB/PqqE/SkfB family radical SAM enzyme
VISTIAEIKRQARERNFNSFHFSFSGGEPTMHPGYLDIMQMYAEDTPNCNYQSVHMTTNMSQGMKFLEKYADATQALNRVSITASWHREAGLKDIERHKTKFADKLVYCQERDIQVTVNMVMVPDNFDTLYAEALYFHERGINVTLKPQSDPTASFVVHGYTDEMLKLLHNGMPQRDYTGTKAKDEYKHPKPAQSLGSATKDGSSVPQTMQVEFEDEDGKLWFMDQAERFNAFGFNKFEGWLCDSGYRSIIIREPDGVIKRSYSCRDEPLGHIETGFKLFPERMPCITKSCVSSADSKIPKRKIR